MRTIGDKKILSRGGRDGPRIRAGPGPVLAGLGADGLTQCSKLSFTSKKVAKFFFAIFFDTHCSILNEGETADHIELMKMDLLKIITAVNTRNKLFIECYCVSSKKPIMCENKPQTVMVRNNISLRLHVAFDWLLHNGNCQIKSKWSWFLDLHRSSSYIIGQKKGRKTCKK